MRDESFFLISTIKYCLISFKSRLNYFSSHLESIVGVLLISSLRKTLHPSDSSVISNRLFKQLISKHISSTVSKSTLYAIILSIDDDSTTETPSAWGTSTNCKNREKSVPKLE